MKYFKNSFFVLMAFILIVGTSPLTIFAGTFTPTLPVPGGNNTGCFHQYDNDSDSSCNLCGFNREDSYPESPLICFEHVFDNDCVDDQCNNCTYTRDVPGHTYDDGEGRNDTICNVCNEDKGPFLAGDADGNGVLEEADFILIQKHINGHNVKCLEEEADYNNDGKINNRDLVAIQRKINNWTPGTSGGDNSGTGTGSKPPSVNVGGGVDIWP